ncbi:hypothetical protein ACQZ6B_09105 [Agrobacterium vitis]
MFLVIACENIVVDRVRRRAQSKCCHRQAVGGAAVTGIRERCFKVREQPVRNERPRKRKPKVFRAPPFAIQIDQKPIRLKGFKSLTQGLCQTPTNNILWRREIFGLKAIEG